MGDVDYSSEISGFMWFMEFMGVHGVRFKVQRFGSRLVRRALAIRRSCAPNLAP